MTDEDEQLERDRDRFGGFRYSYRNKSGKRLSDLTPENKGSYPFPQRRKKKPKEDSENNS